jgi:hypothetical protein
MMTRAALITLCIAATLCLWAAPSARADAAADWQQIQALDSAPPTGQWKNREEARAGTLEYLAKQEQALRAFVTGYPDDAHAPDAKLRLAHLLATRADLEQSPRERREAEAILDQLEREPAMRDRRADVEFARISIFMQRVDAISGSNRDALLEKARAFGKEFPDDRRLAALFAEVASVFEDEPKTARGLLEQARPVAKTPELRARIDDDLKRLALLGKPLEMKWTSVSGTGIDLGKLRGKVVLIYFFATWSAPSMAELDWVRRLGAQGADIQALGICLDNVPETVPAMLAEHGITWPVYCDGLGWQGPLVRGLGINALPVLWIVNREGILVSLDARQDANALIDKALRQSAP